MWWFCIVHKIESSVILASCPLQSAQRCLSFPIVHRISLYGRLVPYSPQSREEFWRKSSLFGVLDLVLNTSSFTCRVFSLACCHQRSSERSLAGWLARCRTIPEEPDVQQTRHEICVLCHSGLSFPAQSEALAQALPFGSQTESIVFQLGLEMYLHSSLSLYESPLKNEVIPFGCCFQRARFAKCGLIYRVVIWGSTIAELKQRRGL